MAQTQKRSNDIRILSVVWYKVLPPVFGGQKGVALFNEYIGQIVPLICLCSKDNERLKTSYTIDNTLPIGKTQFLNPLCWRKIFAASKKSKATHLFLEFPYYGLAAVLCKRLLGLKLVLHSHNNEALRFKEQGKQWWKALFILERWVVKNADTVFLKTERDREKAIALYRIEKSKTLVVPYGIESKSKMNKQLAKEIICSRHNILPETKILLFAATLDYKPNATAVKDLETKLIPLLDAKDFAYKIIVCGRIIFKNFFHLKNIQNPHLIYAGNVKDIDAYFAAADLFLAPVLSGGGVQTKMIDALNVDLNVVCFEGMNEGIIGADKKIFIAPKEDWTAFADATMKALGQHEPIPAAFFDHHDWKTIAEKTILILQNP